jgi:hypothetical protein
MKRYKISESKLNEFWGLFGKKKPETIQQIIDDDPILKKLDAELADINQSYVPRLRQMKKEDPKLFKKMQDMGIIGKDFK